MAKGPRPSGKVGNFGGIPAATGQNLHNPAIDGGQKYDKNLKSLFKPNN